MQMTDRLGVEIKLIVARAAWTNARIGSSMNYLAQIRETASEAQPSRSPAAISSARSGPGVQVELECARRDLVRYDKMQASSRSSGATCCRARSCAAQACLDPGPTRQPVRHPVQQHEATASSTAPTWTTGRSTVPLQTDIDVQPALPHLHAATFLLVTCWDTAGSPRENLEDLGQYGTIAAIEAQFGGCYPRCPSSPSGRPGAEEL